MATAYYLVFKLEYAFVIGKNKFYLDMNVSISGTSFHMLVSSALVSQHFIIVKVFLLSKKWWTVSENTSRRYVI